MTGGNVSEFTDELAHMCEWEDMAARDLGLRACAASPMVDCPKGDYPKMPCVPAEEHHREKVVKVAMFVNAMISRPVGRAEMLSNTKAMDSMKKEWKGFIDPGVFDLSVIRGCHDVARDAKQKNEEVHMARAHGIIVEKHFRKKTHAEITKVVGWCWGTRLRTRRRTWHCFKIWQILLQLSKLPDGPTFLVALMDGMCRWLMRRGHISKPRYGVALNDKERWNQFKRPVVRLVKALHGDAGTFWEQHCDESVRTIDVRRGAIPALLCRSLPRSSRQR